MTKPKPSRVRQPLAVVADLTQLLVAHGLYFTVGGRPSGICGRLIAELRRSLAPRTRRGDMRGSDADPKQKRCSQCGKLFASRACGPTHAVIQNERALRVPHVDIVSEGPPLRSLAEILRDPPVLEMHSCSPNCSHTPPKVRR